MKFIFLLTALLLCSEAVLAQYDIEPTPSDISDQNITPSHVYQKTQEIITDIKSIRAANNKTASAREPGVQTNKRPLHVYSKALEVIDKIAHYQDSIGMKSVVAGQLPLRKVTPTEVYEQAESILVELARVKAAQGIQSQQEAVAFIAGKGPSDVYELMWRASYLLDELVGQTSPNEVFRNTQYILAELELIADKLGVEHSAQGSRQRAADKTPKDVNLEAFKTLHRIGRLERYLDMVPFSPSPFPAGNILPTDALDSTNTILAELVRVKVQLDINKPRLNLPVPEGKTPDKVFDQMLLISARLTPILESIRSRKPSPWANVASQ